MSIHDPAVKMLENVLSVYSHKICHNTRNILYGKNFNISYYKDTIQHISHMLMLNPIPNDIHYRIPISTYAAQSSMTHVSLYELSGIRTKMIIWNPNSISDVHYHPKEHCFFTSLHPQILNILINSSYSNGRDTQRIYPIVPYKYQYIHDSIGSHRIQNKNTTHSAVTFHMYIDEAVYDGVMRR